MLIFVSGHYPIYGTQILYFTDPVLAKRADLPPPSDFLAIEDRPNRTAPGRSHTQCDHAAEPRQSPASRDPAPATARSPMKKPPGRKWVTTTSPPIPSSPVSAGFTEQLDLDLHESET